MEELNKKIIFDMRLASFVTLMKKEEKKVLSDDIKNAIRQGNYTIKFHGYGTIKLGKQSKTRYEKNGVEIKIDSSKIIEEYCKNNGIEIIKESIDDYKVEIIPSEKAKTEYSKMLQLQEESEAGNLVRIARQLQAIEN